MMSHTQCLLTTCIVSLGPKQVPKLQEFQVSQYRAVWQPEGSWNTLMLLCCVMYLEMGCVGKECKEECKTNAFLCLSVNSVFFIAPLFHLFFPQFPKLKLVEKKKREEGVNCILQFDATFLRVVAKQWENLNMDKAAGAFFQQQGCHL